MTAAIRPNTASSVSIKGNKFDPGIAKTGSAVDVRVISAASVISSDNPAANASSEVAVEAGPAFSVEISPEGKALSDNRDASQDGAEAKNRYAKADANLKKQKEVRIKADVSRLLQVERSIRAHEAAHMNAGGGFAGGISFIYSKGPDGRMYVSGGEVSIQASEGKSPEETVRNMEIVRRAALAPSDPSGQDLAVAAAAMQIEARARALIRQGRFLRQSDMAVNSGQLAMVPTSMVGLINTLLPQQGVLERSQNMVDN